MAKIKILETAVNLFSLWVARFSLALLSIAGLLHLLGGVDAMIAYPVTLVAVALLLKETL